MRNLLHQQLVLLTCTNHDKIIYDMIHCDKLEYEHDVNCGIEHDPDKE